MVDAGSIIQGVAGAIGVGDQHTQNERNIDFQKEVYRYQKRLQQRLFEREDSSIRRRVADLQAAGLSPILAAGQGAGTGQAVSVTAPHSEAPDWSMVKGPMLPDVMAAMKMKNDIATSAEQKNLIVAQTKNALAQAGKTNVEAGQKAIELKNMKISGSAGSSVVGKMVNDIIGGYDSLYKQNQGLFLDKTKENYNIMDMGHDVMKLPSKNKIDPTKLPFSGL